MREIYSICDIGSVTRAAPYIVANVLYCNKYSFSLTVTHYTTIQ